MMTAARTTDWDPDAIALLVDNGSSRCSTHKKEDFIHPLQQCHYTVGGYSSGTTVRQKGTVKWTMQDDEGNTHELEIPNTLYCPTSNARILSPQHWAQERTAKGGPSGDIKVESDSHNMIISWEGATKNIPFSNSNNVAT